MLYSKQHRHGSPATFPGFPNFEMASEKARFYFKNWRNVKKAPYKLSSFTALKNKLLRVINNKLFES